MHCTKCGWVITVKDGVEKCGCWPLGSPSGPPKPKPMVCKLAAKLRSEYKGFVPCDASEGECTICHRQVILSPSSVRLIQENDVTVFCNECAENYKTGKIILMRLPPGWEEDFKTWNREKAERN